MRLNDWINERLPIRQWWRDTAADYFVPKNLNIWYHFGSLALLVLVNQLLTGIWLAMHYVPSAEMAFDSVESIMRDVNWGWLLRYLHSTGASAFFIVVYLHIFRTLMYGSYQRPRELLWWFGLILYFLLMAEAFMGYLLPWGQMSYWAAQVITSLFTAIPGIGSDLAEWIRGDYNISGVTLNRFYAFHIVGVPLLLIFAVVLHIAALHHVGSNNPDGIEIKNKLNEKGKPRDGIPFHPYYTVKDIFGAIIFFLIFMAVVLYAPTLNGLFLEGPNFIPADPLQTPDHIAPVWYFTPFYAILRAVPDKLGGAIAMFSAILIFAFLPWLDRSPVRSIRYKGLYSRIALGIFALSFLALGYLGIQAVTPTKTLLAQIFAVIYFLYFLLMPLYTRWEKTKPLPERVH